MKSLLKKVASLFRRRKKKRKQAPTSAKPTTSASTAASTSTAIVPTTQQPTRTGFPVAQPSFGLPLYEFGRLMALREQEEAFTSELEKTGRQLGMQLGLRGMASSSVAAAAQQALSAQRAKGLVSLRRQALQDIINLRNQLIQQLGNVIATAATFSTGAASLAGQVGLSALGGAERIGATVLGSLSQALTGMGMMQGYSAPDINITVPSVPASTQTLPVPIPETQPVPAPTTPSIPSTQDVYGLPSPIPVPIMGQPRQPAPISTPVEIQDWVRQQYGVELPPFPF